MAVKEKVPVVNRSKALLAGKSQFIEEMLSSSIHVV